MNWVHPSHLEDPEKGQVSDKAVPVFLLEDLEKILTSDVLLETGRFAIENELVELRDARIGLIGRGNGLVIRERDGTDSYVIRMGPEHALRIGIQEMLNMIKKALDK